MASILPFDELNNFSTTIRERLAGYGGKFPSKKNKELYDILDMMLDLFLLSYAQGNEVTNMSLSEKSLKANWQPTLEEVNKTVNAEVAGKTWTDRVKEYFDKAENGEIRITPTTTPTTTKEQGTEKDKVSLSDALIRIAETETHRIANSAALQTATKAGATKKTWVTMLDDKVRETHDYLEGETVGIDDDFYTFDDDHAPAPGMFMLAQNNINCRCELIFS